MSLRVRSLIKLLQEVDNQFLEVEISSFSFPPKQQQEIFKVRITDKKVFLDTKDINTLGNKIF